MADRWSRGIESAAIAVLLRASDRGLGTGVADIRGRLVGAGRAIVSSDWRALRCEMYASVTTAAHQTSTSAPPTTNRRSAHRRTLAPPRRAPRSSRPRIIARSCSGDELTPVAGSRRRKFICVERFRAAAEQCAARKQDRQRNGTRNQPDRTQNASPHRRLAEAGGPSPDFLRGPAANVNAGSGRHTGAPCRPRP